MWNGYPIVFADTGTYLSQAIHQYAGWDRPDALGNYIQVSKLVQLFLLLPGMLATTLFTRTARDLDLQAQDPISRRIFLLCNVLADRIGDISVDPEHSGRESHPVLSLPSSLALQHWEG